MENDILSDIYESIDTIVLVINKDYSIEYINNYGKKIFSINNEILKEKRCFDLICKNSKPVKNCPINCFSREINTNNNFLIEHNNHFYKVISKQIKGTDNQIKFVEIFHDVTDLVKKEKEQKAINQEYESLNEKYLSSIEKLKEKNELISQEKEKYELLFNNMNSAFALHEIILDKDGIPCDYRFLGCNPEFEGQTGLKASQLINKTVLEILPQTEKYWIETYGKVALEGVPIHFTNYSQEFDKYFEIAAYSTKKGFFAVTFYDVTRRIKYSKALRTKQQELKEALDVVTAKEQLFQTIFNSTPSLMLLLDEDSKILQMNKTGLEKGLIESDKTGGVRIGDVFNCINANNNSIGCGFSENCIDCSIKRAFDYTLNTGKSLKRNEASIQIKSKKEKLTVLVSTHLVTNKGERNILLTLDDITEKKKEEISLKKATIKALENEAKFKAAFMTSPDALSITTPDGTYTEVNEGFLNLTGYTRKEVIGIKSFANKIWYNLGDRKNFIQALLKQGKVENFEALFNTKNRGIRTAVLSASIIKINNEPFILAITGDITEKRLTEERLKAEIEIAEAFATTDSSLVFHKVLETLLKLFKCEYGIFGYINKKGDLVSPSMTYKIWDKCEMPEKDIIFVKEKWGGSWGESLKKKTSIIKNKNLQVPFGHIKLKNTLAVAIVDKDKLIGQIVLGNKTSDFTVSDKNHLEEFCQYILPLLKAFLNELNYKQEIIEEKEKAEKADRLKSAFLANMSHEIRTPLNGIMGFTDILTSQRDFSLEQKQKYSTIIRKSSETLMQIVNDILDISSLESGNLHLLKNSFNINTCLTELLSFFLHKIKDRNKTIELILKNPTEQIILENDETRFRQIFTNLLDNAIKFTTEGEIQFGVNEINKNQVIFFVSDTGIGIHEDKLEIIFNRFRQGEEESTRAYGGNGLGLAIVKELVQLMGGKIWLNSALEEGTTFYFSLPI